MSIHHLPNEALVHVASYLPSAALLAVAMTPQSSWNGDGELSPASRALLSSLVHGHGGLDLVNVERADQLATLTDRHLRVMLQSAVGVKPTLTHLLPVVNRAAELLTSGEPQGTGAQHGGAADIAAALSLKNGGLSLDFGNIEVGLNRYAAALTDDDMRAILICINAKERLSRLKLDGCVGVLGGGLQPLRGSTSLELIDLGLGVTRLPDPNNPLRTEWVHPTVSYDVVFPILESIVDVPGSVLKYVHLSDSRMSYRQAYPGIQSFMQRYNQMLESRQMTCASCNNALNVGHPLFSEDGKQSGSCYTCLQHFCNRRACRVRKCMPCKRRHCTQCLPESPNEDYFDFAAERDEFGEFQSVYQPQRCFGGCWRGEPPIMREIAPEERVPVTHEQAAAGVAQLLVMLGYSEVEAAEEARKARVKAEAQLQREREERSSLFHGHGLLGPSSWGSPPRGDDQCRPS